MKKRVKEWGREKRDRWEREKTQKTQLRSVCLLYEKKKKIKKKKKELSCTEKKARSFHPARFDHRNANCFHMCFHIWNFFSFFFFFSFPFCLRQNEIVQNKNSFWIYAMMLLLPLSSLELSLSLYFFLRDDRACIFPFDIIVKNYIATKERENQDSWTFNAHVKNSDNYPCNGPLLHQLDYLGFERSRIYFAIYDIICQLCCCTKIFGVWFNNLELY